MDDHLSDKEQVERLRQWWRENGWFLIGGVALGLLGLYGYNERRPDRVPRRGGRCTRDQGGDRQRRHGGGRRAAHADAQRVQPRIHAPGGLLVASAEVVTAPDAAIEKLRFTMERSDDPDLAMVARLRLRACSRIATSSKRRWRC